MDSVTEGLMLFFWRIDRGINGRKFVNLVWKAEERIEIYIVILLFEDLF